MLLLFELLYTCVNCCIAGVLRPVHNITLKPALRRSNQRCVAVSYCEHAMLWMLAERCSNRLDFYSSVVTLGWSSVGPIRMQDCCKPHPSHVMKEGRHRGEERWMRRSLLRWLVHLIVYGRCLQRCNVMLEPKRMRGKQ